MSRVEELCPADDVLGRRWLVAQCPVPFIADESAPTPAEVTREILAGAATGISIKTPDRVLGLAARLALC